MKVLVTGDTHHSKYVMNKNDECIDFIKKTMQTERPSLFVIAGDLNDSQTLKSGSDEMRALIKFVKETTKEATRLGIMYVIIRGTKGHDGEVIQTLHDSVCSSENSFEYVDKPTVMIVEGYKMLFLPEMYTPTLNDFMEEIDAVLFGGKADVVFFHGMMDFAIVQMKQVDSMYGLSKSVLIDSKLFRTKFNICAVGGHFHSQISNNDIIYTDTMINGLHNTSMGLGLGLLEIDDVSRNYKYQTIKNPYNIIYKICNLDFTTLSMEEIDSIVTKVQESYNINDVIFSVLVDASLTSTNNYSTFMTIYRPKVVRKRLKDVEIKDTSFLESKTNSQMTEEEIVDLIITVANDKYGEKIEQSKVTYYVRDNNEED